MIIKITPQPIPEHESPRPKPKRSCSQSKMAFRKASLSNPTRQPGRSSMMRLPIKCLTLFHNTSPDLTGMSGL
jgi:hypothetical protein